MIEIALKIAEERIATKPTSAINLARVEENIATAKTIMSGLINHDGRAPGPPGFPNKARFGPPPGRKNHASNKNLWGSIIISKLNGAVINIGITKIVIRR